MFLPLRNFGRLGVIQDTLAAALPMGAWSDALNVRFSGTEMEKMLEAILFAGTDLRDGVGAVPGTFVWFQPWTDGITSNMAAVVNNASGEFLYVWQKSTAADPGGWVQKGGPYIAGGNWQSFEWGDTVIFNNGLTTPQIWDQDTAEFVDLPGWGLISTAQDIAEDGPPTRSTGALCQVLMPLRGFLVACGVTEGGNVNPNKVWWSDAVTDVSVAGAPSWDYESPATLSGQSEVGLGDGRIRTALPLNENLIIYTDGSATRMQVVGGAIVMQFRRIFNKGAAALNTVAEFNNKHFVVSRDEIYIHDGSTVKEVAKDRVEESFFRLAGKEGRFGGDGVNWYECQVVQNPNRKEINVCFFADNRIVPRTLPTPGDLPPEDPPIITDPPGLQPPEPPEIDLRCQGFDCTSLAAAPDYSGYLLSSNNPPAFSEWFPQTGFEAIGASGTLSDFEAPAVTFVTTDPFEQADFVANPCGGLPLTYLRTGTQGRIRYVTPGANGQQVWAILGGNIPSQYPNKIVEYVINTTGPTGIHVISAQMLPVGSTPYEQFTLRISGGQAMYPRDNLATSLVTSPIELGPFDKLMNSEVMNESNWFLVSSSAVFVGEEYEDGVFLYRNIDLYLWIAYDDVTVQQGPIQLAVRLDAISSGSPEYAFDYVDVVPGSTRAAAVGANTATLSAAGPSLTDFQDLLIALKRNQPKYENPPDCPEPTRNECKPFNCLALDLAFGGLGVGQNWFFPVDLIGGEIPGDIPPPSYPLSTGFDTWESTYFYAIPGWGLGGLPDPIVATSWAGIVGQPPVAASQTPLVDAEVFTGCINNPVFIPMSNNNDINIGFTLDELTVETHGVVIWGPSDQGASSGAVFTDGRGFFLRQNMELLHHYVRVEADYAFGGNTFTSTRRTQPRLEMRQSGDDLEFWMVGRATADTADTLSEVLLGSITANRGLFLDKMHVISFSLTILDTPEVVPAQPGKVTYQWIAEFQCDIRYWETTNNDGTEGSWITRKFSGQIPLQPGYSWDPSNPAQGVPVAPRLLRAARSIIKGGDAYLSFGAIATASSHFDVDDVWLAWERNKITYTPPFDCPGD